MAYTPFTKDDQPTMQAFNDAFEGAVKDSLARGVKIEVGSYVGTGTYGSSNKNSITFGFVPKVVIFSSPHAPMMNPVYIDGVSTFGAFKAENTNYSTVVQVTASGKTLSWYNASGSLYQGNNSGTTYRYVAIG